MKKVVHKIKRGSVKVVRKGSTKIVKRAIPTYKQIVSKMTKAEVLNDLYMVRSQPTSERYKTDVSELRNRFNMSNEDIIRESREVLDKKKMHKDLTLYYSTPTMTESELIQKWGSRGLETPSDVRIAAMKTSMWSDPDLYAREEYMSGPAIGHEKNLSKRPSDMQYTQMDIVTNSGLYKRYKREISDIADELVRNGKITLQESKNMKYAGLLDIVDQRPEYAAVVYYIMKGGNIHDKNADMKSISAAYRKGKPEFIFMMNEYKLNRSRHPTYQSQRQLLLKDSHESKQRYLEEQYQKSLNPIKSKNKNKYTDSVEEEFITDKKPMESDIRHVIIDKVAKDLYGEGREDRRKRKLKVTPKRRIIKKKIMKRCRCK